MKKVKFPELEKIKKLCASITVKLEAVESEIERRTEYYDSKSENWQDSAKGEEYLDKTENLEYCKEYSEEQVQNILDAVEELEGMQDE